MKAKIPGKIKDGVIDIQGKSFLTASIYGGDFEDVTELSIKLGKTYIELEVHFDNDKLVLSGSVPVSVISELVEDRAMEERIQAEVENAE
ncbi:MAG TPA: hypothetical protein DCS09_08905 [Porphyromonadaceae bacterium]|nr:hypothetical protein [Porphyromonadaceae bacterium]